MSDALIIDTCRTPRGIGKQGKGAMAHLHPQHPRQKSNCRLEGLSPRQHLQIAFATWNQFRPCPRGPPTQQGPHSLPTQRRALPPCNPC